MSRKKTHEEFVEEMQTVNPNIKIMSKYQSAKEKVICNCLLCNNEWYAKPNNLLNYKGCPKCSSKRAGEKQRKTQEEFVQEMAEKNPNIEVIGKYINNQTPIACRCKICNNTWDTSIPINLLKCDYCCPECFKVNLGNSRRMQIDEYLKRLDEINSPLIPIEEYKNRSTPILHECKNCGSKRKYIPHYILDGGHCVICQGSNIIAQYGVNSLFDTHPKIANMMVDKELAKRITFKSTLRTDFICPNCGCVVKNKEIRYVIEHGFSCQKCSDGISYPMKFVCNVLEQLNVEYKTEVTFKNWTFLLNNRKYKPRYDIVFDNYIIEVDGGFHKKPHPLSHLTLEDIKYIDSEKDKLAYNNGFNLIRIDAVQSNIEYMKKSILSSQLPNIFDLSTIDWNKCHENSLKSNVKEVCDIWNSIENPSVKTVHDISGYNESAVRSWLKQGAKIGLCDYDPKEQMKNIGKSIKHGKKIICLNNLKIFNKVIEGAEYYDIDSSSIIRSCKNKNFSGGKDKETNAPLYWMYYEDYLKEKEVI